LSNNQLLKAFGVSNAGGMRWSKKNSHLIIVADHTKSLYEDRRVGEVLYYTGMGRIGDQSLSGQNARLAAQRETGIPVQLFEVFERNKYIYAGRVTLAEDVYEVSQPDDDGNSRSVFVFPLRLSPDGILPTPRTGEIRKIRAKRERDLLKLPADRLKDLARQGGPQKPGRREAKTTQYERNEAVVAYVKVKANGRCDLCGNQAPFESKKGPYLECHHIQPLAKGGPDVVENAIALCPNCHRRMHILNLEKDKIRLRKRAKDRES
jgi:5-methylcytosine-specific restriction protein A